ncbi:hypothetical protein J7413_00330 [Shimia sp. R10_1]|uniref:uracil-DNA glycosylase family protein n=1 Tax=Shimia sp. R10_1 TaxID=2821095 RepID=UPI001ADC2988|nr:uracil-DNA glycosylase family protein [Shimia sp. R10_1]MBO9471972.1 hypothetical protein [Shimia sp. R10_1]
MLEIKLQAEIEDAYRRSRNSWGWRLLASPENTLSGAQVAFIGLNPGGTVVHSEHSIYAMPSGHSAYVDESWAGHIAGQSPLQRQVRALFSRLDVAPHAVLAGNLVPFRSPDWKSLQDPKGSLAFGKDLWSRILSRAKPPIVITMGGDTTKAIVELLGVSDLARYPVGWGNVTAQRGAFDGGTLIGLPHLSRFGIMTRTKSADFLDKLFEGIR